MKGNPVSDNVIGSQMTNRHELPSGKVSRSISLSIHFSGYTKLAILPRTVMSAIAAYILVVFFILGSLPADSVSSC